MQRIQRVLLHRRVFRIGPERREDRSATAVRSANRSLVHSAAARLRRGLPMAGEQALAVYWDGFAADRDAHRWPAQLLLYSPSRLLFARRAISSASGEWCRSSRPE